MYCWIQSIQNRLSQDALHKRNDDRNARERMEEEITVVIVSLASRHETGGCSRHRSWPRTRCMSVSSSKSLVIWYTKLCATKGLQERVSLAITKRLIEIGSSRVACPYFPFSPFDAIVEMWVSLFLLPQLEDFSNGCKANKPTALIKWLCLYARKLSPQKTVPGPRKIFG